MKTIIPDETKLIEDATGLEMIVTEQAIESGIDEWWCETADPDERTGSWLYSGNYIRKHAT